MKVTKAQAQANRAHVVATASQLFRERGFDGVGVADLMAAAGFTHGGFYKQFGSKADLMAESTACGIAQTTALIDLVHWIAAELGVEARIEMLPDQPGDVPLTFADVSKAREMLGYEPKVPIREGLKRYVAWYRARTA